MKQVYTIDSKTKIFLKDGTKIEESSYWCSRDYYHYGIVPKNEEHIYNYEEFIKEYSLCSDNTLFKKREYINYSCFGKRVYKEDFDKAVVIIIYKIVEEPRIDWLQNDLNFNEYSELVFNRENELRKMLER